MKCKLIPIIQMVAKQTIYGFMILLVGCSMLMASDGRAQYKSVKETKITLNVNNGSLKKVLSQIENSTQYKFTYEESDIKGIRGISVKQRDQSVENILLEISRLANVSFRQVNNNIHVRPIHSNENPIIIDKEYNEQLTTITGRVTSTDDNDGLPGVTIIEKGTSNGTITDADGRFALGVSDPNGVLVFSYVGYVTEELSLNGASSLNVTMVQDVTQLGEILVVGYGERKKENYTGAVSTVGTKEIVQAPVANISNALVGRLSGLIAVQRNGEPGQDGSNLLIRGMSTTGDNSPLVVIDGIPRDGFSQLDPNEIETLTLLKDPASAAVFGVRAANGVILITTKRGQEGKSSLNFSVRSDWQKPVRLPKYLDSYGYANLYNEARLADGNSERFTQDELNAYRDGTDPDAYPNTDWIAATLADFAPQQQYNLSLSGGTQRIRYFVSAGHVNQKGLYANSAFKRYNFRSNIDANVTSTTKISFDISGRIEDRKAPSENADQLLYYALFAPPIFPATFSNGLPGAFPTGRNPAERARSGGYNNTVDNVLLTNAIIEQQLPFIKGLSIKGIMAYDKTFGTNKRWNTPYTVYQYDRATSEYVPIPGHGVNTIGLSQRFRQSSSLTLETHLNYARTFNRHEVGGLLLYSQNQYSEEGFFGSRNNFISPNLDQFLAGNPATQTVNGDAFESGRRSVVGRLNYALDGKYLLEGNFRYDGVSTFAPGRQYGFFPSVSVGWKISDENFIQNNFSSIDFLKIRSSYGVLGNDRIAPFRFLSTYGFGSGYPFGEGSNRRVNEGLQPSAASDPNSSWETAQSFNIGLDGSIYKRLLGFEVDWFYKRTSDILITPYLTVPDTYGRGLPTQNLGIVDNRGVEISLTHEKTFTNSGLTYYLRGNFTYAKSELIYQDERTDVNPNVAVTGRRLGQFFGYKAIGLFTSQEEIDAAPPQPNTVRPGDIRYADVTGRDADGNFTGVPDGKVDGDDMVPIGYSAIPEIIFGLSGGVQYRNFDLNFLFQGATRVSTFLTGELAWPFYNGAKALVDHTDYWRPDNLDAKYPRITENPQGNNIERSDYWLRDASYVRLKNLELGYTLPDGLSSRLSITSARFFISGQNLLTFDKLKIIDPEGPGASGTNFSGNPSRGWFYPQQKVYAIGLNVNF